MRLIRRPDVVYAPDLGPDGIDDDLDDGLAAAVAVAASCRLPVVLAGLDDARAAAERLDQPVLLQQVIVADADRALAAVDDRWTPVWSHGDPDAFPTWLARHLWRSGIGPMLVAIATCHADTLLPSWAAEDMRLVLGPDGPDAQVGSGLAGVLHDLVVQRARGALPSVDKSPGWHLEVGPEARRSAGVHASVLTLSAGVIGVRGDLEDQHDLDHLVLVSGAFGAGADGLVRPLPGPAVTVLDDTAATPGASRRVLDLHTGVVTRTPVDAGLHTVRFVSLSRPGVVALRGEDPRPAGTGWAPPLAPPTITSGSAAVHSYASTDATARVESSSGTAVVTARAEQHSWDLGDRRRVERIAAVQADADGTGAADLCTAARAAGFDALLDEHRRAWASRWEDADIEIVGDPAAQLAIRFALFQLLSCAPTEGEAAVGARGLTGLAYAGHVFWDTDVFVLPALAATLPAAARAVLQYRINRLDAARENAASRGLPGARFPWESADTGHDVTPTSARDIEGRIIPIRTGEHEEHINADIPWALHHYLDWTGDTQIMDAGGRALVLETARCWQARVRLDDAGRGHLYGVIGPDEYHEIVDDNAYTNNLVRWHLRWAAAIVRASGSSHEATKLEATALDATADALVDGFDPERGCHEQFAGFWDLEPLLISEVADTPVAADMLLGRDRVRQAQVLKQPDVMMLHHLLPDLCPPGSFHADLDFYLPRTSHGSSLSPAICAAQLARDGRPDEALALFDIAARLDLDDLSSTAAGGLHLATMGGVWQAVVHGFAGIRSTGTGLAIDPHLPRRWDQLTIRLHHRGRPVRVTIDHHHIDVQSTDPVPVVAAGQSSNAPVRICYAADPEEDV